VVVRSLIASLMRFVGRHVSRSARIRRKLSRIYLAGDGIEVGALHNPLPVGPQARVKYVDRLSRADLLRHYPELAHQNIAAPDIIDNGEVLSKIGDTSLDFIIANHFVEHCENPIATLINFFTKLKSGGIVYLAVPDKRFTFDRQRTSTNVEHLQIDYHDGGYNSREQHYLDFARHALLNHAASTDDVTALAKQMMDTNYSIHFHVWTREEFLGFLHWLKAHHLPRLEIIEAMHNCNEGIFVLRKQADEA
jgi:predicted SAM-dependent methyltransferase